MYDSQHENSQAGGVGGPRAVAPTVRPMRRPALRMALLLWLPGLSQADCPPTCPDAGFLLALKLAAQQQGLNVPANTISANTTEEVLEWHRTRPLKDRHFYKTVAREQLRHFEGGISREAVQETLQRATRSDKYQLIPAEGRILRSPQTMFGARNKGIEYFMQRSLPTLKRRNKKNKKRVIELAVNCRDWPQSINGNTGLPLFSFSKRVPAKSQGGRRDADIMYPAWAFWEGGPWLKTIKTWQWPAMRRSLSAAAESTPWADKLPSVFFRGSRTSGARDPFVLRGHRPKGAPPQRGAERWDARYVPNQSQRSNDHVTQVLGLEFVEPVTMEEHCRYKYLLNFDGQAASFRLKTLFLCGAVVLMVDPVWDEFWYGMLVPFVHYVPLAADGSDADATLDFLEAHQDWAEAIAENGRQFVLQRLRMEDVQGYWDDLLTRYSMLQSYEPAIDTALATVVGPAAGARAEL